MRSTEMVEVALIFREYARKIQAKAIRSDPNFIGISIACEKVCYFISFSRCIAKITYFLLRSNNTANHTVLRNCRRQKLG